MLLKIQRYDEKQSFWLLDDIRKISVSENIHVSVSLRSSYDIGIFDIIMNRQCACDGINIGCAKCKYYKEIICRTNSGDEFTVAFDTIAYVLNDNGKTIEKIVANYND